jgi:hypothetical protein
MIKLIIGITLVCIPFIGIGWMVVKTDGWKLLFKVYGGTIALCLPLFYGLWILNGIFN